MLSNFLNNLFSHSHQEIPYSDYEACKKLYSEKYPELRKLKVMETDKDVICKGDLDDPRFNTNIYNYIGNLEEMNWGYAGTGPWLLALNILFTFTDDLQFANKYVFDFRKDFLMENFCKSMRIPADDINKWIRERKKGGHIVQ